jgi:hypothetical protein
MKAIALLNTGVLPSPPTLDDVLRGLKGAVKKPILAGAILALTAFTNAGTAIATNRFIQAGTAPKNIGWGIGTTTAAVTQTALVTPG